MQSCLLISVGGLSAPYYKQAVGEYEKRLQAFCRFKQIEVQEERIDEKQASEAVVQNALQKEGERILGMLPPKAQVIALCVEGKSMSSEEFAALLQQNAMYNGSIAFVIGSSHGLHENVKNRADMKLSGSAFTLPHQLCRVMLTEQIYRGYSIIAGQKYHK